MSGGSLQMCLYQPETIPRLDNVRRVMAGVCLPTGATALWAGITVRAQASHLLAGVWRPDGCYGPSGLDLKGRPSRAFFSLAWLPHPEASPTRHHGGGPSCKLAGVKRWLMPKYPHRFPALAGVWDQIQPFLESTCPYLHVPRR